MLLKLGRESVTPYPMCVVHHDYIPSSSALAASGAVRSRPLLDQAQLLSHLTIDFQHAVDLRIGVACHVTGSQ